MQRGYVHPVHSFALSSTLILRISALHPSLHAEPGAQLRAGPAEPGKPLERAARGGPRQGTRLSLCPRGGPSAGLQGPLVATGSRGPPGAARRPVELESAGVLGAARLDSQSTERAPTASPEQPQLLLFCRKKEKGNQCLFFFPGLDEESGRGIFNLRPVLVGFPSSLPAGLPGSGWRGRLQARGPVAAELLRR